MANIASNLFHLILQCEEPSLYLTLEEGIELRKELNAMWAEYLDRFDGCGDVDDLPQKVELAFRAGKARFFLT